jgi:nucleotide-binding universal stress UspA family protein
MATEIKKVLFTTDLSPQSRKAFDYAVSLAARYGARITILHVIEELPQYPGEYLKGFLGPERWRELQESNEQEARQILIGKKKEGAMIREALRDFCKDAQKDHGESDDMMDEIVVSTGKVVDEILTESETRKCDLIVMGYYVRGRFEEAIVGSTPRRLLRRSKIPIMLVPLPDRAV